MGLLMTSQEAYDEICQVGMTNLISVKGVRGHRFVGMAAHDVTKFLLNDQGYQFASEAIYTQPDGSKDRARAITEVVIDSSNSIENYYKFERNRVGEGSYGSVYIGKHLASGKQHAVKCINKLSTANTARLKRELLILKRLDHPSIVRIYGIYEAFDNIYIACEMCKGGEVFDQIVARGGFGEAETMLIMKQILSALAYIHARKIMHRDIKPENLLLKSADDLRVTLIDWGFAVKYDPKVKNSSIVGTPYYISPEVLAGKYAMECDVWSAGVLMYILLCASPPFNGANNEKILASVRAAQFSFNKSVWNNVSALAKNLISKMLTFDPEKRITASQALNHGWFRSAVPEVKSLDKEIASKLTTRFKVFQTQSKFKKFARRLVAFQLTDTEIGSLYATFQSLDENNTGVLSIKTLIEYLSSSGIDFSGEDQHIIESLTADYDNGINYTDFISVCLDASYMNQESSSLKAFRVLDPEGTGFITIKALRHGLSNMVERQHIEPIINDILSTNNLKETDNISFQQFMSMVSDSGQRRRTTTLQELSLPDNSLPADNPQAIEA